MGIVRRKRMGNKLKITIMVVVILVLAACGGDKEELMSIGEETITERDYIEQLNKYVPSDEKQALILEKVTKEYTNKDELDKEYKKAIKNTENMENEGISKEEKDFIKDRLEVELGLKEAYKKAGLVNDEEIEKEFGEGKKEYSLSVVVYEEGKTNKAKLKEVLKEGKEKEKELKELDKEIDYSEGIKFNEYTVPKEFEEVINKKKGFIGERSVEGTEFMYKIEEVTELKQEEVNKEIVNKIGVEKIEGVPDLIDKLEKEGEIKVSKEMREYLDLDKDKVNKGEIKNDNEG